MTRRLAGYLPRKVDDADLARQWSSVEQGIARAHRRQQVVRVGLAGVVVIGLVWALVFRTRAAQDVRTLASTSTSTSTTVDLPDGSRLRVAPGASARVVSSGREDVRIVLEGGRVDLEASHDPARRSFVVSSADWDVVVVGTVFWMVRRDDQVEVGVREGRVQVRHGGSVVREVGGGEVFSSASIPLAAPPSSVSATPPPPPSIHLPAASARPAPRHDASENLFESAQRARAEGRFAEAARLFDDVRHRRRSDRRAPLAAFELGRIRLEVLGDPAGAVEAFSDALALGPDSALAEDAEARRVEALGKAGQRDRCIASRDAYVARYPRGVYVRVVSTFCK
jgi:hypothetical protein